MDMLCERVTCFLNGGILGKNLGWISDVVSLTVSGLKSHAHGSEGEEEKLSIPGKIYLIRPHRHGCATSLHEIERSNSKNTREAIRATVLWKINDILLSCRLWEHHGLCAYIHGLDRVKLREVGNANEEHYRKRKEMNN